MRLRETEAYRRVQRKRMFEKFCSGWDGKKEVLRDFWTEWGFGKEEMCWIVDIVALFVGLALMFF